MRLYHDHHDHLRIECTRLGANVVIDSSPAALAADKCICPQICPSALPGLWAIRHQIMGPSQCFPPWARWCHRDLSGCRFASRAPCSSQGVHNTIDEWLAAPHARFSSASDPAAVSCHWRVAVPTFRLETSEGLLSLRARLDQTKSRGVFKRRSVGLQSIIVCAYQGPRNAAALREAEILFVESLELGRCRLGAGISGIATARRVE